jgi:hypothetical protein
MSERPTQTPASSATESQASGVAKPKTASGTAPRDLHISDPRSSALAREAAAWGQRPVPNESLAARAERFRNGAPFLVERATLYDPDPLDLPVAPADRRLHSPGGLLPAALTLLGVVVVVGLAAGVLFVRNADGPRIDERTGRLEQFSERAAPRPSRDTPSLDAPKRRDELTYDLTRRSTDTIVGAWRAPNDVQAPSAEESKPVAPEVKPVARSDVKPESKPASAPEVVAAPPESPRGIRRLMPNRLTGWLAKRRAERIAEPAVPPRAPLDDPTELRKSADGRPAAPLDEPHVPKVKAAARSAAPGAAEHPGSNVVARVGRETDPEERGKAAADDKSTPPVEPPDADKPTARERYAASRARRAQLRRLREARRDAIDLDRFLVRDKGNVPFGFVFSGPQGQRP